MYNDKHAEKEFMGTFPFKIVSKTYLGKYVKCLWKCNTTKEKNRGTYQNLHTPLMDMDWENSILWEIVLFFFCLFVCFLTRSNLEIQCNSHWNCSCILLRNGGENFNIPIEAQKTLHSQTNPKYKDQSWEYHHMWFQVTLRAIVIKPAAAAQEAKSEKRTVKLVLRSCN